MTAESLRRAGNPAAAVDMCRDALIRFPGHLSARVTLGWALLDLGKLSDAQQEFEAVRRQAPDNLAAIRGLAKLHTLHDGDGFQEYEDVELPPAPVQWSAPEAPTAALDTLDSLDDLDPYVAADDLDPFVVADPPETPEPPETVELFEPLDEGDACPHPVPPTVAAAPPERSTVVFRLERWLARVEARRSEGLTECA